jgi:SAM-dependent methyltransferase
MICVFSVINHMEHEDAYLYFKEALRIVRPGGRFVFSCLPIDREQAREVFFKSAGMDMQTRHTKIRHVVTSKDLIAEIARLAGWTPVRWYDGDEEIRVSGGSRASSTSPSSSSKLLAKAERRELPGLQLKNGVSTNLKAR